MHFKYAEKYVTSTIDLKRNKESRNILDIRKSEDNLNIRKSKRE